MRVRTGATLLCAGLLGAGQAAAQAPGAREPAPARSAGPTAWSLSVEAVVAAPGEELDPFVEGAGFGASATVGRALSPRWRLLLGGGLTWFDGPSAFEPAWRVWQARSVVGFDLLGPGSRAELLLTLGGGVASFDPGEPDADIDAPPPPLETVVVPSLVAGVRLGLPLADGLGLAVAPGAVRTIPVEDDEPGPDSSWMWELAVGLVVGI